MIIKSLFMPKMEDKLELWCLQVPSSLVYYHLCLIQLPTQLYFKQEKQPTCTVVDNDFSFFVTAGFVCLHSQCLGNDT